MDVNDSRENSSSAQDTAGQTVNTSPVLSPETIRQPSHPESSLPDTRPSYPESSISDTQSQKKSIKKRAIIISVISVFLVGGIVTAGLAMSGAFSKDDKAESSKSPKRKTVGKEEDDEEDEEEDDEETSSETQPHEIVTSLYGITDDLLAVINSHAEEYFTDTVSSKYPDGITVTSFNYIGITMTDDSWSGFPDTEHSINTIYQVIVEDATGRNVVERQFFWFLGIHGIYKDGSFVDTNAHSIPGRDVCFDNWCTQGFQSFENINDAWIVREAMEKDIDVCLILPINHKPYEEQDNSRVDYLSEITRGQMMAMDDHARDIYSRLYSYSDVEYQSMELIGQIMAFDDQEQTMVVLMVYEITAKKGDETCTYYWYWGFEDLLKGGEMRIECGICPSDTPVEIDGIEVCGLPDIFSVKDNIRDYSGLIILECNIEGYEQKPS